MSEPLRTANSMAQEESWRVRLLRGPDRAGRPLGAGVLLPGGLVLTCAHVVLLRPGSSGVRTPLEEVYVDVPRMPAGDATQPLRARLLREYLVMPTGQFGGDLALLKLDHEPAVPHAVLHRQIPARGDMVHFTGYPEDLPGGEHLDARLMGRGGPAPTPEWVQLDALNAPYVVRRGYSGCAVVHSRTRRVIGIVAHQFGTPQARVHRDHAYMIPTETVLKHLPLERLGLTVTGKPAVSHDVAVAHERTASGRVPGLHRRLTRWLDGAPDTDPVEPVFAGEGEHDLLHTVRSVLTLADREQSPPEAPQSRPSGTGAADGADDPQAGTIDIAVDATNRTVADLARDAAERIGLDPLPDGTGGDGGPDGRSGRTGGDGGPEGTGGPGGGAPRPGGDLPPGGDLLARIAAESPPLSAAILSVDRSASTDDEMLRLLTALLARGQSRLLLVFSDPRSPLLARVRAELLGPHWAARRTERLGTRVSRLAETEQRLRGLSGRRPPELAPRLRRTLGQLGPEGPLHGSEDQPHALFRCAVDIEAALLVAETAEQELAGPAGPREFVVGPPGDGLTDLPSVAVRDPDALVTERTGDRLEGGERLHQQYEVVGPIGQGNHGKVYLARDLLLENRPVALKGILDPGDPAAVLQAHQERLRLVSLNHPSVIRVVNYARHEPTAAEFIVMEFADGAPLSWVGSRIARRVEPFAGPRVREFIVAYGLLVLEAFDHLHEEERLVYGDLSLTNVLHCGTGIKLIDVAGVREPGAPGPVSHRPPDSGPTGGMTTAGDLYTVGAVLGELLAKDPSPPSDLGTESLRRALSRATATDPRQRYASAQEMAVQLRGVLRELRSLRLDEETFEPSPLFDSAAIALDGRLGRPPPLERWRADGPADRLGAHVPEPAEAAVALPVPKADVQDPNWKELQRTSYDDPAGLLQLSNEWLPSPELHLLRCRLHLELAGTRRHGRDKELVTAAVELERAGGLLGDRARYDWRLDWHRGLTQLAHGRLHRALNCFDEVYAAIPGEYAPKLALGYCHEKLADEWRTGEQAEAPEAPTAREAHEEQAMLFYDAVWRRNHALGAAAFGLARIHLARHSPDRALASLDGVPPDSRHRTAARTAMVRIHAGTPTVTSAVRAHAALHRLAAHEGFTDRQAQERLTAELREQLLELVRAQGVDVLLQLRAALPAAVPLPATERELREQLSTSYRQLAKQVPHTDRPDGAALAEALLDNAYSTRPLGLRHARSRGGRRSWFRSLPLREPR
ncbi:tetratricopeptide repeat protein [Streptomyces peucetius]|uniref:Trypsin-like peptidase domain-containing protein n=1 Tax=Streptomyces peucetius TaxID=1950 RepID=A0ABY6I703_STRPE|nr:tetratricopeptide repeat protein [Streptomyces peucetius]UYQ62789.1 trypsin-like peptidase domain-containing protein [Streptomyces peucetius]